MIEKACGGAADAGSLNVSLEKMEDYFRIGVVTAPHGIHGEMKIYPTTDDLDRFKQVDPVLLTTQKTREKKKIESVKYFKGMAILKLSGIDSMNEAEKYRKAELWVERSQLPKVPGKYLIADLIGMDVITEEKCNYITGIVHENNYYIYIS